MILLPVAILLFISICDDILARSSYPSKVSILLGPLFTKSILIIYLILVGTLFVCIAALGWG